SPPGGEAGCEAGMAMLPVERVNASWPLPGPDGARPRWPVLHFLLGAHPAVQQLVQLLRWDEQCGGRAVSAGYHLRSPADVEGRGEFMVERRTAAHFCCRLAPVRGSARGKRK